MPNGPENNDDQPRAPAHARLRKPMASKAERRALQQARVGILRNPTDPPIPRLAPRDVWRKWPRLRSQRRIDAMRKINASAQAAPAIFDHHILNGLTLDAFARSLRRGKPGPGGNCPDTFAPIRPIGGDVQRETRSDLLAFGEAQADVARGHPSSAADPDIPTPPKPPTHTRDATADPTVFGPDTTGDRDVPETVDDATASVQVPERAANGPTTRSLNTSAVNFANRPAAEPRSAVGARNFHKRSADPGLPRINGHEHAPFGDDAADGAADGALRPERADLFRNAPPPDPQPVQQSTDNLADEPRSADPDDPQILPENCSAEAPHTPHTRLGDGARAQASPVPAPELAGAHPTVRPGTTLMMSMPDDPATTDALIARLRATEAEIARLGGSGGAGTSARQGQGASQHDPRAEAVNPPTLAACAEPTPPDHPRLAGVAGARASASGMCEKKAESGPSDPPEPLTFGDPRAPAARNKSPTAVFPGAKLGQTVPFAEPDVGVGANRVLTFLERLLILLALMILVAVSSGVALNAINRLW